MTAAALTKAAGEGATDAEAGVMLLEHDRTITGEVQVLADSAYGTGELLRSLTAAGHIVLIKPEPLARAIEGGFTIDDFTYDHQAGTLTCPNGLVRTITAKGRATFGAGCTGCPLRLRCTTAAQGRKVHLHPEHALMREHRTAAQDDGFQADYTHHRPMLERSMAWLVKNNRRLRYRGRTKNHAWWQLRVAAVNLKRMLKFGLTTEKGSWANRLKPEMDPMPFHASEEKARPTPGYQAAAIRNHPTSTLDPEASHKSRAGPDTRTPGTRPQKHLVQQSPSTASSACLTEQASPGNSSPDGLSAV